MALQKIQIHRPDDDELHFLVVHKHTMFFSRFFFGLRVCVVLVYWRLSLEILEIPLFLVWVYQAPTKKNIDD